VVQTNSSRDCRIKFRFPVPLRWTTTERKEGRRRRRYTSPNCVFPLLSLTPNGSRFLSVIVAVFLTTGWIISNRWQQHRGLHLVLVSQRRRSGDRTGQDSGLKQCCRCCWLLLPQVVRGTNSNSLQLSFLLLYVVRALFWTIVPRLETDFCHFWKELHMKSWFDQEFDEMIKSSNLVR